MSFFDLSHYKLFTCDQGYLIPAGIQEVLPGDTFQHHTSLLIRTQPLLRPVMHPVHASVHHWFVPFRLIWEDWENFITGGEDGEDASVYPTITINSGSGFSIGSLGDYFGLPTGVDDITFSALPFRAYNLIFNEFYRDQQLQTKIAFSKSSGVDTTTSQALLRRCWEKDRFTSSRPDAQLGPEVTLPLGTTAPVIPNQADLNPTFVAQGGATPRNINGVSGATTVQGSGNWDASGPLRFDNTGLVVDLEDATSASINQLREAFAIQRFQENRNRYGGRYPEYLMQLGIVPSDARLQRPEYLGGGKQTIQFSEVLQTAPAEIDTNETPVGDLAGHGIGSLRSRKYRRFFEEHGFVITLVSVKPVTMYTQGLQRLWNRRTKYDFWQKELQHIGSDEVLLKEIYAQGTSSDEEVFGFQDRNDDYRHAVSTIAGEFRTTENMWHMGRIFGSAPALNASFVQADPTDRIYATGSTAHQLQIMANHTLKAKRLMAQNGTASAL